MYQKERIDEIMEILTHNGYVTVKFLTEQLHYSNATINRDLNVLEKQKLVKRSYGGVELVKQKSVPLPFRYNKMKSAKNKIAKKAAELISDGDTVFIDATTTTEYMVKYLAEKKNITVITNNMSMVSVLSEYDVDVVCLGGRVVEKPNMLSGDICVENARSFYADKLFFASASMTSDGKIGFDDMYYLLIKTMAENSDKLYYLGDHEKVNAPYSKILCDFSALSTIITDYIFDDDLKKKYSNVDFFEV